MQHCNTVFYLFRTSSIWGQNNRINHMDNLGVLPRKWSTDGGWIPYAKWIDLPEFSTRKHGFYHVFAARFFGGFHRTLYKPFRGYDVLLDWCIPAIGQLIISGWLTYPSEKSWSLSVGIIIPSIYIHGIIKFMFQTTNQILYDSIDGISMTTWKKKPGIQMALSENRVPTNRLFSLHFPNIKMASREIYPFFRPTSK